MGSIAGLDTVERRNILIPAENVTFVLAELSKQYTV
jgi:hypothetical protein